MLSVPQQFQLRVPPPQALDLLKPRIARGEDLLTAKVAVSEVGDFRRGVRRWQAENDAIVESILEAQAPSGTSPGRDASSSDPIEELKDDVSEDVSRLSQLVYRIQIVAELPTAAMPDAGIASSEVESHAPSSPPAAPRHEAPPPEPEYSPDESAGLAEEESAFSSEASDDDGGAGVEEAGPPEVSSYTAGEHAESSEAVAPVVPVTYAAAASAALPAYDADAVAQRDLIGIDDVVNAFSYLIAARALQPPLAVGLFGNWGSGKTFLLRAIQRRVDEITRGARESARAPADIGVYRRIVQIEFNAWHYVEGNLWASLVDHIFSNLRTSSEEGGSDLDRRRQAITEELASTREEQRRLEHRRDALRTLRAEKAQEVEGLKVEQRELLQEARQLHAQDVAAAATLDAKDRAALDDALSSAGVSEVYASAVDAARSLADARHVIVHGNSLLTPLRQHGWRWTVVLIAIVAVAPLTSLLLQSVDVSGLTRVLTSVGAFLSAAAVAVSKASSWASRSLAKIEAADSRLRQRVDEASAEQARTLATLEHEIDALGRQLSDALRESDDARAAIDTLEQQLTELTPGKLLASFLEQRFGSADYRKHLGLTAVVRRDFEELSRLVTLNNDAQLHDTVAPGPDAVADFNRVVLYVDDLDRCPPRRVVEVLQAVHLLLSFPVFVVVVAVDPRWLAQSLSSEYPELLGEGAPSRDGGHATPNDYLEKIFQIPFSLAPLDVPARRRFVEGLLDSEAIVTAAVRAEGDPADVAVSENGADESTQAGASAPPDGPADSADLASRGSATGSYPLPEVSGREPPAAPMSPSVDLNPASLRFTSSEIGFLEELLPLLETSPRSVKRYINIYRLIKSVAGVGSTEQTTSEPAPFQSAMLLLALQTGTPGVGGGLVRRLAEDSQTGDDELGTLVEQLEVEDGDEPELAQLRAWLALHPAAKRWPASSLAPLARHVRMYAFG